MEKKNKTHIQKMAFNDILADSEKWREKDLGQSSMYLLLLNKSTVIFFIT